MNYWIESLHQLNNFFLTVQFGEWGYWSYLILAILVAFEGPVATLLGAAAASAGVMRPYLVFISASTGNLIADSMWYFFGYMGKIEWMFRVGKRFGIEHEHIDNLQKNMKKHAVRILFFAKLSMSLMIPSLIAAGLVKAPWKKWFPAVFGGELIWTGSLVLIGFYATEAIKRIEQGVEYFVLGATLIFIVGMLILGRRILRKSETEVEDDENSPGTGKKVNSPTPGK